MRSRPLYGRYGMTILILCLACAFSAQAQPKTAPPSTGDPALNYGFRFATAIETADKNKAMAQQLVTLDFAAVGELDRAVKKAAEVIGWRRGVAYAELAAKMVEHLFSVRNAVDPADAYRTFRGRDAKIDALMRDRGFPVPE